ncbi:MAG TPA: hypothetical protein VFJ24_10455, partial [Gaiellales bacterium]|nr:hypothetical protein [Gaiellales bacterium]
MKLLFAARPLTGHVYPLLPLARAASARGHEVAFATGAPMLDDLRRRGLTTFAAGLGDEGRREFHRRFPPLAMLPPDAQRALFWGELFAGIELGPRLASLGTIIRGWRPDVIVHDVAELGTPIAATEAGIPYATAGFGLTIPPELVACAAAAAAPHWRAHGLDAPPRAGLYQHLYVDPCPISLRAGQLENMPRQPIRLTANVGQPPRWLAALPGPVVYLTLGTVWNTDHALFGRVLDAIQTLPISVVVTL